MAHIEPNMDHCGQMWLNVAEWVLSGYLVASLGTPSVGDPSAPHPYRTTSDTKTDVSTGYVHGSNRLNGTRYLNIGVDSCGNQGGIQ